MWIAACFIRAFPLVTFGRNMAFPKPHFSSPTSGCCDRIKASICWSKRRTRFCGNIPNAGFCLSAAKLTPGYWASLLAGIQRTSRPERFVFAGYQSDTAPYIAASDVVCLASVIEAQSKIIPQAFAMNKLVVAPNVGGIPELVRNRENGLLYEREKPAALAEALAAAFTCDREMILACARAAAERLDIQAVMEQTEKLYTSLVA